MKKLFLSSVLALVLVISFGVASAHAAAVTGWAWSSNIGWIQFNTGVASPVTVDVTTGLWSGYAWSSNIGWISFNSNSCGTQPKVIIGTGQVSGWAKALSAGGGWDGCIELAGTNHASLDSTGNGGVTMKTATGEFVGFAWGGDVVGWVHFNPSLSLGDNATCPGCSGGGVAPVITGSCSAVAPYTNVPPGTSVKFIASATSGTGPYEYSWNGAASTTNDYTNVSYSLSGPGPTVRIGDSAIPVNGYSSSISCPSVTVLPPLGTSNMHINKGTSPSSPSYSSISVNKGVATPFNVNWNVTLTSDYIDPVTGVACTASIGNDPGLASWNSGWTNSVKLKDTNGTDNGDGTYTWNGNTGAALSVPATGLAVGSYQFKLTCAGGSAGTQTTSATLRVTSTSENEL